MVYQHQHRYPIHRTKGRMMLNFFSLSSWWGRISWLINDSSLLTVTQRQQFQIAPVIRCSTQNLVQLRTEHTIETRIQHLLVKCIVHDAVHIHSLEGYPDPLERLNKTCKALMKDILQNGCNWFHDTLFSEG